MEVQKIYFDMDGVVADFNRGVAELCHLPVIPISEVTEAQDDEMWKAIRAVGHFYDKLEPIPGAVQMFRTVAERYGDRCEILTGIPKKRRGIDTAGADKIAWAHRILSPDVVVNIVYAEEKKNFCKGKTCILIDDLEKNIRAWEAAGGTGVLCRSPQQMTELLHQMGVI